jgi:hypothetical protein
VGAGVIQLADLDGDKDFDFIDACAGDIASVFHDIDGHRTAWWENLRL